MSGQEHNALRARLQTVQLVPPTAFDAHGKLALDPMRRHWQRMLEAGIRVFLPCAGSAEFHSLSADEIVSTIQAAHKELGGQAVLVAPVGGALPAACDLAKRCLEVGADAILVMPLEFPYLSDAGARDYYRTLLDFVNAPVLIYKKSDIPSDQLLLELGDEKHLIGVKYAVNDIASFQRVVETDGGRLAWYCGSAERYAPYFALAGASGYTSGAGNICPRITLAMQKALEAGKWKEAIEWQRILLPIEYYRARSGNSYNVSFLKYAMRHCGYDFGHPRPPQRRLTADEMREIDAILTPLLQRERQMAEEAVQSNAVSAHCS
jgi:4-hydroxy-tetrahydrodipicolinate synthase